MFRRRNGLNFMQKMRRILWPVRGWKRSLHYLLHRLKRLPGEPSSIAMGVALGAAVSFTPFLGLHILISFAFCLLLRANMVAAVLGTLIGNPWTFPFMWWISFQIGAALLGLEAGDAMPPEMMARLMHDMSAVILSSLGIEWGVTRAVGWDYIQAEMTLLFLPWLIGGMIMGFICFFCVYFPLRNAITRAQQLRHRKRSQTLRRIHEAQQEKRKKAKATLSPVTEGEMP